MIYDCFLFFNELELLELRLELLYDKVDYFVISECDYTFSGIKKPFYYNENKHLFTKYHDKIIHLMSENSNDISRIPDRIKNSSVVDFGNPIWCREWIQRECIKKALVNCYDTDIIITSDLDEIPDPSLILNDPSKKYSMRQHNMIYSPNWKNITEVWVGPQMVPYHIVRDSYINELRSDRFNMDILEGGWHLTYMGGYDRIKTKIESYSHQEFNNDYVKNNIKNNLINMKDVLGRDIQIQICDILPKTAVDILTKHNLYL